MYAIFEAKGKQWRAEKDVTIRLPSLDAEPGERVVFDRVLLAQRDDEILVGRPVLASAAVSVEVTRHGRGEKIVVFKRKRRKNYRRKQGHRQAFTEVRVVELDLENATAPAPTEVEEETRPTAEEGPAADETAPEEAAAPEADGETGEAEIDVTPAAEELAAEHDVRLGEIEGTGKEGRILKSDVETAVEEAHGDGEPEASDEDEAAVADDLDITDAARDLAEEHGIDVAGLEGTGKEGRILKSDVEEAIEEETEE